MAQAINSTIKDVVMPSPNAASLGKYGDIPVSYYTGVPSVGIPIHTVRQGAISLPISLDYHAGGVKVGEPASWVGLGWSLQAGGMISRTVQGRADERNNLGYMSIGHKLRLDGTANECFVPAEINGINYTKEQIEGELTFFRFDGEPDIFSFSIGGYSGKFYIDAINTAAGETKGKVILVPKQDLRVEYDVLTLANGRVTGAVDCLYKFTVTTPNGTKYEFGDIGDANPAIEISRPFNSYENSYASGWYLKKVTASDGINTINLNYTPEVYQYAYRTSYGINTPTSTNGLYDQNLIDLVNSYRLSTISSSIGTTVGSETVTFVAGGDRDDVSCTSFATTKAKKLSAIQIQNGVFCKKFTLNQSYFYDNSANKSGQATDYRLKLNSVQESKCDGDSAIAPHTFIYNGQTGNENYLPNRLSSAIDHWGYANGASSNPKKGINIPYTRLKYHDPLFNNNFDVSEGESNRETNEDSMKLGTIRQIQYPTGGTTTFDLEANTYWDTDGVKKLVDDGILSRIGICSNSTEPMPHRLSGATGLTRTFNSELDDMFYEVTYNGGKPIPSAPGSCEEITNATIFVFVGNSVTPLACSPSFSSSTYTPQSFSKGKLLELFPCLQMGVDYFFAISVRNMSVTFNFKRQVVVQPGINRKVGGLRIKSIKSNDGISTANDVTKTYKYVSGGVGGPNMSSGKLYNKPLYGYKAAARAITNPCSIWQGSAPATHYWVESSIAPLGGFEGNHIGYSLVQEYYNANGTGYYTNYQYHVEAAEPILDLPLTPLQPRISSGELEVKTHWDNDNLEKVAEEINTAKADTDDKSYGEFFKCVGYNKGVNTHPVSYKKFYQIRNRPYRLSKVESWNDGIKSETNYTYDAQNRFYAPTEVTTTNSDGKIVKTKTYYAHNAPSSHPNNGFQRAVLVNKFMIGIPLQTEQFVNNIQVGGSILEYTFSGSASIPLPYKAYSLNKDLTTKLNITVDTYVNGLPTSMTKAGYTLAQTYSWDTYGRLTGKAFGGLSSSITYHGTSSLVHQITDENGFKSAFYYDGLMRLQTTNTFFADNSPKSTTRNTYVYGGATNPSCNRVASVTSFTDIAIPLSSNQIFDGLGRTIQGSKINYGPNGELVKSAVTYDNFGRTDRSYQPFIGSNPTCAEAIPGSTLSVQTQYELSPLSRPIRQIAEDGRFMTTAYGANVVDEVRKFTVTGAESNIITAAGNYAADVLYKTVMTNENGKTTTIFKDKLGRVMLTRKVLGTVNVDTYNVYDDYGNLVMVIPPDAITGNVISADLVFTYKYNNKNQLCEKKIPGADVQRFYYNDRDLLTFTQDGNMRVQNANRYLATEYDQYGRVWRTSWIETSTPAVYALSGDFTNIRTDWMNDYYYDTQINPLTNSMYNRPTGVRTRPFGAKPTDKQLLGQTTYYNAKGQVDWVGKDNLSNTDWHYSEFNAAGKMTLQEDYHYGMNGNQYSRSNRFYFDRALRATDNTMVFWGGSVAPSSQLAKMHIAEFNYNFKDQLIEKNVGRNDNVYAAKALQSIDYQYNQRGWLTEINQQPLSSHNQIVITKNGVSRIMTDPNPVFNIMAGEGSVDLFAESIRYDNPNMSISNLGTPQYNGNISQAVWQVTGREQQAYTYKYDDLDRLLEGEYTDIHDSGSLSVAEPFSTDNKFGEKLTYDLRGNITSLIRNGMITPGLSSGGIVTGTFGQIDNLAYVYGDSNRVKRITDGANAAKGFKYAATGADRDYDYDKNGNLVADRNKGITRITYNYLNLPQTIEFTYNRRIEFVYDATGAKLRKTVIAPLVADVVTDYMDGFEYKNGTLEKIYHAEGYVERKADGTFQYNYTLKDHLGNTRVTFADLNNSNTIDPNTEINQINHYAPFGLNLEGNWNGASADAKNKFQYNGKELQTDFGLDWNDYGARNYDAATGRFPSVDPLADIFAFQSPYAYAANNPIKYIDFMGMSPVGADGMTNEQWMSASNPATNGSQATNGKTAASSYQQANRDKEIEKGTKKAAWEITSKWDNAKIADYRLFVDGLINLLMKDKNKFTCEDFVLKLVVTFAKTNGLPFLWETGSKNFDAARADYNDFDSFLNAVMGATGAKDFERDKNTSSTAIGAVNTGDVMLLGEDNSVHHVMFISGVSPGVALYIRQGNAGISLFGRIFTGSTIQSAIYLTKRDEYTNYATGHFVSQFSVKYQLQYRTFNFLQWNR